MGTPLTNPQHETFALAFVACFGNAAEAARRAGYSDESGNAATRGWELLGRPDVRDRIDELSTERFAAAQVDAATVLRELVRIAMCDIAGAFDADNNLLPIHDMPEDVRRAISSIKIEALYEGKGEEREQVGYTKEVKFWTKTQGLEMLARTLAMFKDSLSLNAGELNDADANAIAARVASLLDLARKRRDSGDDLA
jgi:phage terminase small subunit